MPCNNSMPVDNAQNDCGKEPKPCDNALTPVNIQCLAGPSSISYANKIAKKCVKKDILNLEFFAQIT